MSDQKDENEGLGPDQEKTAEEPAVGGPSRRTVLKSAAGITAVGAAAAGSAEALEFEGLEQGLERAIVNPLQRDRIPPSQGARNWITNVAYWYEFPSNDPEDLEVWGYTDKLSYAPGEEVSLHVNTTADTYEVEVQRDGAKLETVMSFEGVQGAYHETPIDCYATGCGWPVSHRFSIPADWKSGGYIVVLRVERDGQKIEQEAFFTLRAADPGADADILFILSTGTWIAYSDFGGGSSYRIPPEAGGGGMEARDTAYSTHCHIHRPWARGFIRQPEGTPTWAWKPRRYEDFPIGSPPRYPSTEYYLANGLSFKNMLAGWAGYDSHFARWAEREGYTIEYADQHDFVAMPNLLDKYKLAVVVGHDEYITPQYRNALDRFIEAGGKLARFAGNLNWQVRFEDNVQICYKHRHEDDPVWADPATRHLASTWWHQHDGANNPPVTTWGVNGHKGVYAMVGGATPRGSGGFTVYRNKHWAFADADLYYGDVIGGSVPVIGSEVDGVEYTFRYGLPFPTGEDGAPLDLEILAMAPGIAGEEVDHGHPPEAHFIGDSRIDAVQYVETLGLPLTEENIDKFVRGCAAITNMKKGQGEVFCAGTLQWVHGLHQGERFIEAITRTVIDRYTAG